MHERATTIRPVPFIVLSGFVAGAVIAVLAFVAEHSRIGVGDYALYGNGALIVPAVLAPWALYWGWTEIHARGGRALEMAIFVIGLHFGVGVIAVLDTLFFPQQPDVTVLDALPGLALTGTIFVIPGALLAGLTYRLFTTRLRLTSWTGFGAAFLAALLIPLYWLGLGILAGMCVAAARRDLSRRVRVGIALLVLLLAFANLPYFPALFG